MNIMEQVSLSVQELAPFSNGGTTRDESVVKSSVESSHPSEEEEEHVPVVDMNLLLASSPEADKELLKFRTALSTWGCVQAINHGLEHDFMDKVEETNRKFYSMPPEEKLKYSRPDEHLEGYGVDDKVLSDQQLNDRLYLFVYPENIRKLEFWPQEHGFSETLHELTLKMKTMFKVLLQVMGRSLNLESSPFLEQNGEEGLMLSRINFYPACSRPEFMNGFNPHSDASTVSVLLQDSQVEGLQVLRGDEWVVVPIVPHALLILVGDQAELISNGVFKRCMHRVTTNPEQVRISTGIFVAPQPDREIGPADELVDESRPRMYKNVKNYPELWTKCFTQGKKAVDVLRI